MEKTKLSVVVLLGLVLIFLLPHNAVAFSYTLKENLPEELTVYFRSQPNGPIRRGDNFKVEVIVKNSSSKPFPGVQVSLSPLFSPPLGLRAVEPQPHNLNDFRYHKDRINWHTVWEDQIIPAKGEKKYSITFRLHPGSAEPGLEHHENISLQVRPSVGDRLFYKEVDLPISPNGLGERTSFNSSYADNLFYAAAQRFPTKAESQKWTKILDKLEFDPGPCIGTQTCNKGSYLLDKIKKEFKKKIGPLVDVSSVFKNVYGKLPTTKEKEYWTKRLVDKPDTVALKGAMYYQKSAGRTMGK